MKYMVILFCAGALLVSGDIAAQTSPDLQQTVKKETKTSAPPAPVTAPLCVGTAFNALLSDTLDTRKVRAGDAVTAEVAEDVNYESSVIFPKGTKILGHIVRATSGGGGRTGSALFIQFDKAVLKDGQEVILNAGIQALAVGAVAPVSTGTPAIESPKALDTAPQAVVPVEEGVAKAQPSEPGSDALIVSTVYASPRNLRPPLGAAPAAEGELNSDGLFTPESKGAFGRPDVKVYTPTSQGSRGTVLLSAKKHLHLDSGTRLLLVVQPPAGADQEPSEAPPVDQVNP